MQVPSSNLFSTTATAPGTEVFTTLLDTGAARIERIVSCAHASPEGFWYDQPDDEWVLVLEGEATLEFDPGGQKEMRAGDHLFIPRHTKHRVRKTSPRTLWLAVHLKTAP